MAKWPGSGSGGGFDYVQDTEPNNPTEGEEWYDTGANEAKVYDGANWHNMTVGDFAELAGSLANTQIPASEITEGKLAFDTATQTELNNAVTWSEDGNSPLNASGASSHTYNLASTYDIVRVIIDYATNTSGASQTVALRLNGVTGTSYSFKSTAGNSSTGNDKIQLAFDLTDTHSVMGVMRIRGREIGGHIDATGPTGHAAGNDGFLHGTLSGLAGGTTLDSFTIYGDGGGNIDVKARVYGANL